jgi:predicted AlkP superfamily pyrophosphatase or phosphodiesterase
MQLWRVLVAIGLLGHSACEKAAEVRPAAPKQTEQATRPFDRVVVVSIDGLRPVDCARTATLRKISSGGAFAAPPEGVLGVTPSVTYPSHTSMTTGVYPARHGIVTNFAPDEQANAAGWRWYSEDVAVDTVHALAYREGLRTALISWPVTVGAEATVLVPEYWRAGTLEDVKLLRALSTPGFLAEVDQRDRSFRQLYRPPKVPDHPLMSAALTALERVQPDLLLLHMFGLDTAQHKYGPDSEQAIKALEEADRQLARMLEALEKSARWPRTALFVVSDHGFAKIDKQVMLKVHLLNAKLDKRVEVLSGGGFAYFYLDSAADSEAAQLAHDLFEKLSHVPAQGIAKVLDRQAISAQHGDPAAFLAVEAAPGFGFSKSTRSSPVKQAESRGTHGYLPERPEMRASLMVYGPRIAPQALSGKRLVDLAPTIAAMLGLNLPNTDGRALNLTFR